jgi:hypothetical protein
MTRTDANFEDSNLENIAGRTWRGKAGIHG